MRNILIISILLVGFSCSQKPNDKNPQLSKDSTKVMTVDDIDGSLKNVRYRTEGNNILDTIFIDSLVDKISLVNLKEIHGSKYLVYTKYLIEEPMKYDMSYYYESTYLTKIDTGANLDFRGELHEPEIIKNLYTPLDLGNCCGGNCTDVRMFEFESIESMDSVNYIYITTPQCSDWQNHILVKDQNGILTKLFEIESSDFNLKFELENDSILKTRFWHYVEDSYEESEFRFDYFNNQILKNTVPNNGEHEEPL
jgi:hypothetical protein